MKYQLYLCISTRLVVYSQKHAKIWLSRHRSARAETSSVFQLEYQFEIKMRVSQYLILTSCWMLRAPQCPTGAVRSGGAERRRRLTAKVMVRVDLDRLCYRIGSTKELKHAHCTTTTVSFERKVGSKIECRKFNATKC